MTCSIPEVIYDNPSLRGVKVAFAYDDGYSVSLEWYRAYSPLPNQYQLVYNIYFSSIEDDVFAEGVKYVVTNQNTTTIILYGFTPGDTVYFGVRPSLHDINYNLLSALPDGYPNAALPSKIYTSAILLNNISDVSLTIPVSDIDLFPAYGIIQVGHELIKYSTKDLSTSSLIVNSILDRGFYASNIRIHDTDGYDGVAYQNPIISYFKGFEDASTNMSLLPVRFAYPAYPYTYHDGYRQSDITMINTDLSASDAATEGFRPYSFAGWRRHHPVDILKGECIGSYFGGEVYCADGYEGVGRRVRGLDIHEHNNNRQELLLETDGQPCVLLKRLWKGTTCRCVDLSRETPEPRCVSCMGVGIFGGYQQFFNSRRSDGKILVRFGPTQDDVKIEESGLESTFNSNCWTLVYPTVRDRDILIRFNQDGTEEFRYEIMNVTRNIMFYQQSGGQKFDLQRVRKTDIIYQWRAIRDTSTMPQKVNTSIGFFLGPNGNQIPHTHTITINENITTLSQVNQTTSFVQGHEHPIVNGVLLPGPDGHTHSIII